MNPPLSSSCRVALLTGSLLIVGTGQMWAQAPVGEENAVSDAPTRLQGGVGVVGVVPAGEFETHVPDGSAGVMGHLDVDLGGSVLSLGGEVGWMLYGDESRTVSLASLLPEVPSASVEVNTWNAMFTLHSRLRAQRRQGRWRPYVDGLFGLTDIYTKSEVKGGQVCGFDPLVGSICVEGSLGRSTQSRDFVLSYGGGVGVMVRFGSRERSPRLDIAVRYLSGGEAEYLTEGAVRRDGDQLVLDFTRSRTDMMTVYVGVAFGR